MLTKGGRIDYVKLVFTLDQDRAAHILEAYTLYLEGLVETVKDAKGKPWHINSLGATEEGQRRYSIDVWGPVSHPFFENLAGWERVWVRRLDYRVETEITEIGLSAFEQEARQWNSYKRTITRTDSRPRSKKGGRDAGGMTVAVGARGSDKRLSVYARGGKKGAVEYQARGDEVTNILVEAQTDYADAGFEGEWYDYVYDRLADALHNMLTTVVHQDIDEVEKLLALSEATDPMLAQEIAQSSCRAQFLRLDKDQRAHFLMWAFAL